MMSKAQAMFRPNTQHSRVMNLKFRLKYRKVKHRIKNLIYENSALCDEVAQVQADLHVARDERRYLVKRLMRHEDAAAREKEKEKLKKEQEKERKEQKQEQQKKEKEAAEQVTKDEKEKPLPVIKSSTSSSVAASITTSTAKITNTPPVIGKKRGPKKRLPTEQNPKVKNEKPRNKTPGKVIFDEKGKPIFPINLYNILLHSIGEILPTNKNFHNAHWIYPVGYIATRVYAHPRDPKTKCFYTCKILNNDGTPQFQIIPDNDLDSVFFGDSAKVCHQALLKTLQNSLSSNIKLPLDVQGETFFGLANPAVRTLIQMDSNFKLCSNFKGFLGSGGPTGSKTSAPEHKDPTLNFEALQRLMTSTAFKAMPETKEEPPDHLIKVQRFEKPFH